MDPLTWLAIGALLGAVIGGPKRLILQIEGEGSWIGGDTFPVRGDLKRLGARWNAERKLWFLNRIVSVEELEQKISGVSVLVQNDVLAFEPRRAETPKATGHTGAVVSLPGSGDPLPGLSVDELLRSGVSFGTSVPYRIDSVEAVRITNYGGAEPAILIRGMVSPRDRAGPVPLVKQLAFRYADAYGFRLKGSIPVSRRQDDRMATDDNPSSSSFGKTKKMTETEWAFEIWPVDRPYTNPETGEVVLPPFTGGGPYHFPAERYGPNPGVVKWKRAEIWKTLYGKTWADRFGQRRRA